MTTKMTMKWAALMVLMVLTRSETWNHDERDEVELGENEVGVQVGVEVGVGKRQEEQQATIM